MNSPKLENCCNVSKHKLNQQSWPVDVTLQHFQWLRSTVRIYGEAGYTSRLQKAANTFELDLELGPALRCFFIAIFSPSHHGQLEHDKKSCQRSWCYCNLIRMGRYELPGARLHLALDQSTFSMLTCSDFAEEFTPQGASSGSRQDAITIQPPCLYDLNSSMTPDTGGIDWNRCR